MFQKASLFLAAVVLIADFNHHPNACRAGDEIRPVPQKELQKKESEKNEPEKFEKVDIGEIEKSPPPELDVDPTLEKPAQEAKMNDEAKPIEVPGAESITGSKDIGAADGGVSAFGLGPKLTGSIGPGIEIGGGSFGGRGSGHRQAMLVSGGGNKESERAVTAALVWLANHQLSDGSWSLQNYTQRCTDKSCTGTSTISSDSAVTAFGLLPFFAAGQTHKSKGKYREHILRGVQWLIQHQQPDGNLAKGASQMMYSQGLATIALCEAYDNPMLTGGVKYLMRHLPDQDFPNIYYWYYGTQVMHNMGGTDWDRWNRTMRDILVRTQVRNENQCANGSWDPDKDAWGRRGGRVMLTSLSALTLEIYYRYLPIYSVNKERLGD